MALQRQLYIYGEELEIPQVYNNDYQQGLYETEYRNGRVLVDRNENVSMNYLKTIRQECVRGYLDGIRDELLFQEE